MSIFHRHHDCPCARVPNMSPGERVITQQEMNRIGRPALGTLDALAVVMEAEEIVRKTGG